MQSDGIWNNLELPKKNENNVSKACILTLIKMFMKCRILLQTMSQKHAFWQYLKILGNAKYFHNNVSKACILTVFETIWNCREKMKPMSPKHAFFWNVSEMQTFCANNVSKACILTLFETIGTCREQMKTISLKYTLWRYLKWFGNADKGLKTMSLKHAFWSLMVVETDLNCRKNRNNISKACIRWCLKLQKQMGTRMVYCALWRYMKRFGTLMSILVVAHPSPHWPSNCIAFLGYFAAVYCWFSSRENVSFWIMYMLSSIITNVLGLQNGTTEFYMVYLQSTFP